MPIDVHAHYVPPTILEEIDERAAQFGLSVVRHPPSCTCALHFNYGLKIRPFFPKLIEPVSDRIAAMEKQGVTRQVLSCWADIFAYGLPLQKAAKWHRFLNEHLAKLCAGNPNQFSLLASVPLPHPQESAAELEYAVRELGAVGAVLAANVEGTNLGEFDLDAFWQKVVELNVGVFIHPVQAQPAPRSAKFGLAQIAQYTVDTTSLRGVLDWDRSARQVPEFATAAFARRWHISIFDWPVRLHARADGPQGARGCRATAAVGLSQAFFLRYYSARSVDPALALPACRDRTNCRRQRLFVSASRSRSYRHGARGWFFG